MRQGIIHFICFSICMVLLGLIILLSASIKSIEVNTYGLNYSPLYKTVDKQIYQSGIHWIGFAHSFIEYPQQLQTIGFGVKASQANATNTTEAADTADAANKEEADRGPIEARTTDGLTVNFKASFQFQLEESGIYDLYLKYGENYKTPCIRLAIDLMSDEAAKFPAADFFKNLASIGASIQSKLGSLWQNECSARIVSLQLSQAQLPKKYEEALEATNIVIQNSITQKQTQQNVEVNMKTNVEKAEVQKPIIVNQADANKNATIVKNEATINAMVLVTQQETESYKDIKATFDPGNEVSAQKKFLDFFKAQTIAQYNKKNLLLGVKAGTLR